MSSATSFLFHVFFITPICQSIVSSNRWSRSRSFLYAAIFLAAIALGTEIYNYSQAPPNLYNILDVPRTASSSDIKKSYRRLSILYHPDKNSHPQAAEQFAALSRAYEILNDYEMREKYERFGEELFNGPEKIRLSQMNRSEWMNQIMMNSAFFYILWFSLIFLFTIGKSSQAARNWSWAALVIFGIIDYEILFNHSDYLSLLPFFSRVTLKEQSEILRGLLPPLINGARLLSQFTFFDMEMVQLELMKAILESNRILINMTEQVQISLDRKAGKKVIEEENVGNSIGNQGNGNGDGLNYRGREILKQKLQQQHGQIQQLEQKKSGGLPGWLIPIGLFVLFNYILK